MLPVVASCSSSSAEAVNKSPTPEERAAFFRRGPPAPGTNRVSKRRREKKESDSDFVVASDESQSDSPPQPKRRLRSTKARTKSFKDAPSQVPNSGPLSVSTHRSTRTRTPRQKDHQGRLRVSRIHSLTHRCHRLREGCGPGHPLQREASAT